jgi:hypothetical protein
MARLTRTQVALGAAGVAGAVYIGNWLWRSPAVRFARMAGSSLAAPDAVGWVTDFLNAAYYRRPAGLRQVDDLRLAFCVITTYWHRHGHRRLRLYDVLAFDRAFGVGRFLDMRRSPWGMLNREQLFEGAARLLGAWFPAAYLDDRRRGWGIAFETDADRARYHPEVRLRAATLGPLSPPSAPGREQVWHTYPPVPVPSAERAVEALTRVEAWPDYGSEVGRFTPLRERGLAGQTFEIEVVAHPTERTPVFTRGYVTITRLATQTEEPELRAYVAELNDGMRRFGRDEPEPVPEGATPIVGFDLTTHAGHFMGAARNRLLLYEIGGQAYLRAAGTWDPMPWYVGQAYRTAGYEAQQTFWGMGTPEQSMLHQIALATMAPALAPTGHGIPGATSTLSTSEIPGTERPGATGAPSSTGGERPR